MAPRQKSSTTRLPQSILEQIADNSKDDHHRRAGGRRELSRKESRKQDRAERKQKKAEYFTQTHNPRKRAAPDHQDSPRRKKARSDPLPPPLASSSSSQHASLQQKPQPAQEPSEPISTPRSEKPNSKKEKKSTTKPTALERLEQKKKAPKLPRSRQEDEEDAYIAYLEAKIAKSKTKVTDDGLDDLLGWADDFTTKYRRDADEDDDYADDGEEEEEDTDDELQPSESTLGSEDLEYEEEWQGVDDSELPTIEEPEADEASAQPEQSKPEGAYVPPHLRKVQGPGTESEEIQRLTRHMKGLLNRMSEQNISTIITGVEELYRNHRRNDVSTTITKLIIAGISSHSSLLDSYVVLYAAFVASLHKIIGVEFAAHFVQQLISEYEAKHAALINQASDDDVTEEQGKECSNLLVMISELYNFQVISSLLVFDVIRALLNENLTEFNVELLLKITRNSGQQLRQDDPSALKDIVQIVQDKVARMGEILSSRTRFMVETLANLKNNKLKKNVTQNQGAPAVERMKKFLSGISKTKHVLAHEPLRVSLDDLHSAETKGKWWLVGAAWAGDPLVDKKDEFVQQEREPEVQAEDGSEDLSKLARAQGMNTEIRRGIFVVLMSSEDYVDACERLSQLNLTEVQQREIVRVLLHCCGNEKHYNPYYTFVCQQLCRTAHSYKITLQYCLWDFLRDLGETSVGGAGVIKNASEDDGFDLKTISDFRLRNVARAYAWWIAKDSVSLLILKPIDFTNLKAKSKQFLVELFTHIFINSQRSIPLVHTNFDGVTFSRNRSALEQVFIKATRVETLAMGLVYFLSEAFPSKGNPHDEFASFVKWAVAVGKDTLRTAADLSPTLLNDI